MSVESTELRTHILPIRLLQITTFRNWKSNFRKESKRFTVHAGGLGIFTGGKTVLHIPVVRTIELSRFHRSPWKRIVSTGFGVAPLYEPNSWTPHVTLAEWDIDEQNLPKIVGRLSSRKLGFDMKVDNLAIIIDDGTTQTVRSKFLLW
jgi:2'-5' RNA ligase